MFWMLWYFVPQMTEYDSLDAGQILNLGSFVHKVSPHKRASKS